MGLDEERLSQFLAGDEEAFGTLLSDYQGRVFAIILRRGGCRGEEAEDLFQEVWRRVIEHGGAFDPQTSFRPWLYTIIRNVCADHLRRRQRLTRRVRELLPIGGDGEPDGGPDPLEQLPDRGPGPLQPLLHNQLQDALAECRDRLGEETLRATIGLFIADLSQREMAQRLGVSLGTANSWFHQACAQLRRCLERKGWSGLEAESIWAGGAGA